MSELKQKKSSRILTFDIMRGYFLGVILLNHLQYWPSGLDIFTGRGLLYASTAEGFFAVSGIILGMIRGRKLVGTAFRTAAGLLWKRSFQLYLTSIILTVLFTIIGTQFVGHEGLKYGIWTNWGNIWELIWQTLTLQYTYGWADFLRFYAIFLFFAPAALWLLRKGYWHLVIAASLLIWCLFPISPWPETLSQPISWQVIFFGSFIIGYYWPEITNVWNRLTTKTRKTVVTVLVPLAIVTIIASYLLVFGHLIGGSIGNQLTAIHHGIELWFNKDRMPITRILLGAVWFWAIFYVVRKYEAIIVKKAGWFFLKLGENSLYVYTIQSFVVFFAHLFILHPGGSDSLIVNLLVSVGAITIVWLAVRYKILMKIIPR